MDESRHISFRCLECEDTGFVSVWTPATIKSAIQDPDNTIWRSCAVLCCCEAADTKATHWPERSKRRGAPLPVFGQQPWHINTRWRDAKTRACAYRHPSNGFDELPRAG